VNGKKQSSIEKVFAAGDIERGASLVVHAIQCGKIAAASVNEFLS
jgi:glutamate synthase (NADPH/NADH) small chain